MFSTLYAATVEYAGTESGGPANFFTVENWSNALVAKTFDIAGSEKYGTAGYYQICPTIDVDIYENAGEANDLGFTLAAGPTLYSKPPFLGQDPFGAPGIYVNFPGYSIYRGPDGNSLVRQGALSVMAPTPGTSPNGPSNWGNVASFTLSAAAKFRLGLALDSVGSGTYAPNYVTIHNPSTGTVFSAALVPDANTDMVFFDING